MFKPIVVIPTYNHHKALPSMIEKIQVHGIDILIVNDGSDEYIGKILSEIAAKADVKLLNLEKNGGKGSAVKAGIRYAYSKGYTHCIQIDADGQHDISDLPHILDLASKEPQRLILGKPVFDLKNAPKSRMLGRKITNFWIAVETMSLDIKDGLCGYRCYPVAPTMEVINKVKTGDRMDFDPEILVRLRWQGVQVRSFNTKVNYGDHESSNFDVLADNIRISWLFMKLFWIAIPVLIQKKIFRKRSESDWSEIKERGNEFGIYITFFFYKLLKKRFTMIILQPVLFYFFATDKKGREASVKYLKKVYRQNNSKLTFKPGLVSSFAHYNSFASSMLDQIGIRMSGKSNNFKISLTGYEEVKGLVSNKKGAIFIGAHFGNFDIIRLLAKEPDMQLKVLMYRKHAQMINSLFSSIRKEKGDEVIEIDSINAASACMLADYVQSGGFLGILADRVPPGSENKVIRYPFLGEEARFPQGPWILAGILKCPVLFFYAASTGTQKYEIHFERLFDKVSISSGNRERDIRKYLGEYINRLENACCSFPYQWYNFYNFWQE
jgi:predicted LPLAT superfamily acyltransferase